MSIKKILFIICVIPLLSFSAHKYYISLCEVEYIQEKEVIQITLGMFIDDIETTLNKNYDTRLNLGTEKENSNAEDYYLEYLKRHFNLSINDKPLDYNFIGKEYDDDIVRFYLEITGVKELTSFEVRNTSLFRDFEGQKNIIKLKVNKFHKTFYLDKKNDKGLLKF